MKLKSIFHNFIITRIHRLLRSFSKAARSFFLEFSFKESHVLEKKQELYNNNNNNHKVLLDWFRLHYNWYSSSTSSKSSSHLLPMPSPVAHGIDKARKSQYRAGYSAASSTSTGDDYNVRALGLTSNNSNEDHGGYCCKVIVKDRPKVEEKEEEELSSYLQWLEERGQSTEEDANEIDRLADLFIASCHEKFRLEKIESYRRYQEMLARGV